MNSTDDAILDQAIVDAIERARCEERMYYIYDEDDAYRVSCEANGAIQRVVAAITPSGFLYLKSRESPQS